MGDMSDLELVAQAMAPTEKAAPSEKESNPNPQKAEQPQNSDSENIDLTQIPSLSDIDPKLLESLSLEDRQALLPLLNALQSADAELDGEGEMGDLAEILKQMDQAGEVADELESKLDRLIRELELEEGGLREQTEKKQVVTGDRGEDGEKTG